MALAPSFPLRSTFLALPLENEAQQEFLRYQRLLAGYDDCLSLQNPDTAHLTLMFWPEVGELEYQGIAAQAEAIARKTERFSLTVTGTGTFGEKGRDAVVFFAVAFSPELALLKKACPWTDRRAFHPHITLARVSHPERFSIAKKRALKHFSEAAFSIPCQRLRLYGNVGGQKQTPLQDALFAG